MISISEWIRYSDKLIDRAARAARKLPESSKFWLGVKFGMWLRLKRTKVVGW